MRMAYRSLIDRAISALSLCAALLSAGLLMVIIGTLFIGALPALSLHFILTPESGTRIFDGAIGNAVVGTVLISLLATILAVPFALGTAIYLAKYAPKNKYTARSGSLSKSSPVHRQSLSGFSDFYCWLYI